jgi:thiosulfate reductase cytochrome b subunit
MKRVFLHPLLLRIWHWANSLTVVVLIITGMELRVLGLPALRPGSASLLVHKYAGWVMVVSFAFWLAYSLMTGNIRHHYAIRGQDPKGAVRQAKFYLFSIFRGEENPHRPTPDGKFNPLQKLAYGTIMCVVTPMMVVTGILFSDALLFRKYILLLNAVKLIESIHAIGAYLFAFYFVAHVYMATLGPKPSSHIKAMIVGYEEEPDEREGALSPAMAPTIAGCQEGGPGQEGARTHD